MAFPQGCPDLIVTSSKGDIRIWNTRLKQEILRIQVRGWVAREQAITVYFSENTSNFSFLLFPLCLFTYHFELLLLLCSMAIIIDMLILIEMEGREVKGI